MMNMEELQNLEFVYSQTSVGEWKYEETDEGFITVAMDEGHNIGWDMEGSCVRCFANMRFIADVHAAFPSMADEIHLFRAMLEAIPDYVMYCRLIESKGDAPETFLNWYNGAR